MNTNWHDYPVGVFIAAFGITMKRISIWATGLLFGMVLIAIGFFAWVTLVPSRVDVEIFNRLYNTQLTSRQIIYDENGIVDADIYASIPMTHQEFDETVIVIGMINTSMRMRRDAARGPWWFQEPTSEIYILDHIKTGNSSRSIEGHYDATKSKGYFHFFTT